MKQTSSEDGRDYQRMLIPFDRLKRRPRRKVSPTSEPALNAFEGWQDGSYLVGILDGMVVGITPLAKGLRVVDPADPVSVLKLLRLCVNEEVRAEARKELLREYLSSEKAMKVVQ